MATDQEERERFRELHDEWENIAEELEDFQNECFLRQREIELEMNSMPYRMTELGDVVDIYD